MSMDCAMVYINGDFVGKAKVLPINVSTNKGIKVIRRHPGEVTLTATIKPTYSFIKYMRYISEFKKLAAIFLRTKKPRIKKKQLARMKELRKNIFLNNIWEDDI